MKLVHDYLLVKEITQNNKLEGTDLTIKYDDTERFMEVEIVDVSSDLTLEYKKYYNVPDSLDLLLQTLKIRYAKGNHLIINRVAKTPYTDGLYFISFKDVIAFISEKQPVNDGVNITRSTGTQLTIDDIQ